MTTADLMDLIEETVAVYGQVKASGLIADVEKDAPVVISAVKTLVAAFKAHKATTATTATTAAETPKV